MLMNNQKLENLDELEFNLEKQYLEIKKESSSVGFSNPYDYYIQKLKQEELKKIEDKRKNLEKHHIIPRFEKPENLDDPLNLVIVSVDEHILAHYIRWKVLGKKEDYLAYKFRITDTEEKLNLRIELIKNARKKDKLEKKGF